MKTRTTTNTTRLLKAFSLFLVLLILTGFITSCKPKVTEEPKQTVSFKAIDSNNQTIANVEIIFQNSDKFMESLKGRVDFVEKNGEVKSIAGVSEDEDEGTKWEYTLNGRVETKSISEIVLENGDIIEFTLVGKKIEKTITFKAIDGDGNSLANLEFIFEKNEDLIDQLKESIRLEEKDGFITSIAGVSQDTKENVYWLYTINGEEATTGFTEAILGAGDVVEFTLTKVE